MHDGFLLSSQVKSFQIIYQAVSAPENIGDIFHNYFGPNNGIDLDSFN